jgi:hypothetical protein
MMSVVCGPQASTAAFSSLPPSTASLGVPFVRVPRVHLLTDAGHPVPNAPVQATVVSIGPTSLVSSYVPCEAAHG